MAFMRSRVSPAHGMFLSDECIRYAGTFPEPVLFWAPADDSEQSRVHLSLDYILKALQSKVAWRRLTEF